jgi:hypothetical protein
MVMVVVCLMGDCDVWICVGLLLLLQVWEDVCKLVDWKMLEVLMGAEWQHSYTFALTPLLQFYPIVVLLSSLTNTVTVS